MVTGDGTDDGDDSADGEDVAVSWQYFLVTVNAMSFLSNSFNALTISSHPFSGYFCNHFLHAIVWLKKFTLSNSF